MQDFPNNIHLGVFMAPEIPKENAMFFFCENGAY